MKTVLDCTSISSTFSSLEILLQESCSSIENTLSNFVLEAVVDPDDALLELFPKRINDWPYTSIVWFHLTRVSHTSCFENGILPVVNVVDLIWRQLEEISQRFMNQDLDWIELRQWVEQDSNGHHAELYRLKQELGMQGPFGMLIRESAENPHACDNHYLRCPETIEDICIEIREHLGINLFEAYRAATLPVIVKFISTEPQLDCISAALHYAYGYARGNEYDSECNTYFDGSGIRILPEQILSIDVIQEP